MDLLNFRLRSITLSVEVAKDIDNINKDIENSVSSQNERNSVEDLR